VHLLIPYAGWLPGAADDLPLPVLHDLLSKMQLPRQVLRPEGAFFYLKHEVDLAALYGLAGDETGRLPLAALQRFRAGMPPAAGQAWGRISLCHWQIGMNDGQLRAPATLGVTADEAARIWDALSPLLAEGGLRIDASPALPPYARHVRVDGVLADLPCASVERVAGCELSDYLPRAAPSSAAGQWQRILAEAQMLLYQHPINDAREARRQPALNSIWLDGVGALPPDFAPAAVEVIPDLQQAAEAGDLAAWRAAWLRIERECVPTWQAALDTGQALEITLCGLQRSATFVAAPRVGFAHWFGHQLGRIQGWLRPQLAMHWPQSLSQTNEQNLE